MKKMTSILIAGMMILALAACGQSAAPAGSGTPSSAPASQSPAVPESSVPAEPPAGSSAPEQTPAESAPAEGGGKTLIAYFSWSPSGNTRQMAEYIQEQTGGDLLEIEPLNPYPTDYSQCGEVAKMERDNNERPEILNPPASLEEYDTILIGYPIWWHTAPMIIGTFLESYDLTGVEIYPFSQSDSMNTEQFDNSMAFIREAAPGATVHDGLFEEEDKTDAIRRYLEENGLTAKGSHILIAYFTVPETDGVDTVSGASRVATENGVMGNVAFIAAEIQKNAGGDLFAIQTVQEYPGTHAPLLEFAYNELRENARPELSSAIQNLDRYDTVFIGYPNWNADLPMPLYTFFEAYDFSGKTLIPFVTHGGSGFSGTVRTIQGLEPGAAVVEDGLSVSRNNVPRAQENVKAWVDSLRAQGQL